MMESQPEIFSLKNRTIALLGALSLVLGLQVLIAVAFVFSFIPMKPTMEILVYQSDMYPEREMFFYRIFVIAVLLFQLTFSRVFGKRLSDPDFHRKLFDSVMRESAILALIIFMVFKMALYGFAPWIKHYFYVLIGAAVLVKAFPAKFGRVLERLSVLRTRFSWFVDGLILALIALCLSVPDIRGLIAEVFHYDKFYHWQPFIMEPGFAVLKGCRLNVDVFSQYGVGMPIIISRLAQMIGGFTYENVAAVFLSSAVGYFLLVYVFLRMWLRSVAVAIITMVWVIKFQMFSFVPDVHIIWVYPSGTVIRYFFDIIFFIFLSLFLKKFSFRYLALAALCVGMALFHVLDTGVSLSLSYLAFMGLVLWHPNSRKKIFSTVRKKIFCAACLAAPMLIGFLFYWLAIGPELFKPLFWANFTETVRLFIAGFGAMPVLASVEMKQFAFLWIACVVPLVYLFTSCVLFLALRTPRNLLAIVLGLYGLGIYQYYVCRSAPSSYFAVSIPLACLLGYWLETLTARVTAVRRRALLVFVLVFSVMILGTTKSFVEYPNLLSHNKEKVREYAKVITEVFVLDDDAALIRRYVPPEEAACVFSTMAIPLLMQADRKPFLYFANIMPSYSFLSPYFNPFFLLTSQRVENLFRGLEEKKPRYIFIEGRFLEGEASLVACAAQEAFYRLLVYLRVKYDAVDQGPYLRVFQRKPGA